MTIDFHTHCFPEKIASRAMEKLSQVSGGLCYYTDGTIGGIKKSMAENGVDVSVVLSIATNAHQMASVNDFAVSINNEKDVFAFGSVFPFAENALEELERIKAMGLKGIKLHPEYQDFFVDDERLIPIYKKASKLGLIISFHAGYDLGYKPPFHCMPENLRNAMKHIDSPVVAAHWGASHAEYDVLKYLCDIDNLYFDTSFGYGQIPLSCAKEIVEKKGTDKMLFATDLPWHTASMEMRLINSLGLTDGEKEMILYKNAKKLLNI